MIVRMPDEWNAIREQFTEDEKKHLNSSISGETICPRGIVIDVSTLPDELADKFTSAIQAARKASH